MPALSAFDSSTIDRKAWKWSWRRITDKIQTYNVPPAFDPGALLEDIPLEISVYPNAFISRREVVNSSNGVKFNSLAQWYSRGAIYDGQRTMLAEFDEPSNALKFDNPPEIPSERVAAAARIQGRCIYLGTLHGHFGHFLIESLARAWGLLQQDKDVRVIFHYANATGGMIFHDPARLGFPKFISLALDALGIDAGRLILANQDLAVDELLLPTAQFRIGKDGIGADGLGIVYDHIRDELGRRNGSKVDAPRKVYLTRTRLAASDPQKLSKSVANEEEVEALFLARGFEIFSPERLSFEEQIALVSNATHIAGTTGSALHMILFNSRPDALVIAVDWRNSKTQYILEAARGIEAAHIYCFDGRSGAGRPVVDVDVVDQALTDVVGPSDKPRIPKRSAGAPARVWLKQDAVADKAAAAVLPAGGALDLFRALDRVKPERSVTNYHSLTIWALLAVVQSALGVKGDILETGANVSIKLIELLMLKAEEKALFVDVPRPGALEGQFDSLPEPLRRQAEVMEIQGDDDRLEMVQGRRFRWLHVDAARASYEDVRRDLARFADYVSDDGILIVGNFFDSESPDVTSAVFDFLSQATSWKVLLVAFNEAYLVRVVARPRYEDMLRDGAKSFLAEFGTFRFSSQVLMKGDFASAIKGSPHKAIRLSKAA